MSDKYLWDRSGEPDDDLLRLEDQLSTLRYDEPLRATVEKPASRRAWVPFAAAAALVLIVGGALLLRGGSEQVAEVQKSDAAPAEVQPATVACSEATDETGAWTVTALSGSPRCGDNPVGGRAVLPVGGFLETDSSSSAEIAVADIGRVVLSPNSRLALKTTGSTEHRLQLDRGKLYAQIDAPPRLFLVQTPNVLAVDLGCEYTLEVRDDGVTHIHVTSGYVSLENGGQDVYVPAGYMSDALPERGAIAPYADTASQQLRDGLLRLTRDSSAVGSLDDVLEGAETKRDTITLWHLLSRTTAEQCPAIVGRLQALVGSSVAAKCGEAAATDEWRSALEPHWVHEEPPVKPKKRGGAERGPTKKLSPPPAKGIRKAPPSKGKRFQK